MELTDKQVNQMKKNVEKAINTLWSMYDEATQAGNTDLAENYKAKAFQLLEQLPENQVYLSQMQ